MTDIFEFFPKGNRSRIRWAFDALDVCGETVEAEGLTKDTEIPYQVFTPPVGMEGLHLDLYRSHVVELCRRWKASRKLKDLDHPTDAEVLVGLSNTSKLAPLTPLGTALFARLFTAVFGPKEWLTEYEGREAWEGQQDEELARLKAKTIKRPRR